MEITGTIHMIGATQEVSDNFKKKELVINTGGTYPQFIPIQFANTKIDLLNGFSHGQNVKVSINLKGREHNGKYYIQAEGWKIEIKTN